MLTSVIIPAHDEEDYIARTVSSFERSNASYEVIVVANGCDPSDDTAQIAEDLGARVIELAEGNVSIARNVGAEVAEGDNLIFNDADTIVAPDYVELISRALDYGKCDYGVARAKADRFTFNALTYAFMLNVGGLIIREACGNVFVRRSQFDAVGGFLEELTQGEDTDFSIKLRENGAKYAFLWQTYFEPSSRAVSFGKIASDSLNYIRMRLTGKAP